MKIRKEVGRSEEGRREEGEVVPSSEHPQPSSGKCMSDLFSTVSAMQSKGCEFNECLSIDTLVTDNHLQWCRVGELTWGPAEGWLRP